MNNIEGYYYIIIGVSLFIMFALVGYLVDMSKKNKDKETKEDNIINIDENKSINNINESTNIINDNINNNVIIENNQEELLIDNDILNK